MIYCLITLEMRLTHECNEVTQRLLSRLVQIRDNRPRVFFSFLRKSDLSSLMTVVRVSKLRFIWQPSFSLAPTACVCAACSLPARSTKSCEKATQIIEIQKPACTPFQNEDSYIK
jgi:hypothetical protein